MSHISPISFIAGDTLNAQRIVGLVATANTVSYATTTATPVLGITDNYADSGSSIAVNFAGIHKLYFNDTVSVGGIVASDSSGRGVPFTEATASGWYIGQLVGPAVAATGTIAEVLIMPGQISAG